MKKGCHLTKKNHPTPWSFSSTVGFQEGKSRLRELGYPLCRNRDLGVRRDYAAHKPYVIVLRDRVTARPMGRDVCRPPQPVIAQAVHAVVAYASNFHVFACATERCMQELLMYPRLSTVAKGCRRPVSQNCWFRISLSRRSHSSDVHTVIHAYRGDDSEIEGLLMWVANMSLHDVVRKCPGGVVPYCGNMTAQILRGTEAVGRIQV